MSTGQNDGGANNFYQLPDDVKDLTGLFKWLYLEEETQKEAIALLHLMGVDIGVEFPDWVDDVDTLNEYFGESFYFGNYMKTLFIHRGRRHTGTTDERELKKRAWYKRRLLAKVVREIG